MKYMTFNASCSYAGVANMLEIYGFNVEDRQIALAMGLPFLFDLQDGTYCSGPMLQSAEWFNLYLQPNGFHMTETTLPREDVPVFLEKTGCAMLGIRVPSGGKHAVVYTGRTGKQENKRLQNIKTCQSKIDFQGKDTFQENSTFQKATACQERKTLQEAAKIQETKEPSWNFINNRHKETAEPDTFCFCQEELIQRLDDFVTIATLQKTAPFPVDKKPYFRNSVRVLLQLQEDITAFCRKEQSPQALRTARDTLFRAILLDGVTMLGLLENTEPKDTLLSVQRDFLSALKENCPLVLASRISMPKLSHAVNLFIELIEQQLYL